MAEDKNNGGLDLSGMFKDSGTGVKFEGYRAVPSYPPETSKMIQWVMKYSGGYVKDTTQANYVLIGFVVLAGIIVFTVVFGGVKNTPKNPSPDLINKAQPKEGYIPR